MSLLRELAHAARRLRRAPTFSITAVVTVAVSLAVLAALASFWDTLIRQTQPGIRDGDRIVRVQPVWTRRSFPFPTLEQFNRLAGRSPRAIDLAFYSPRILPTRFGGEDARMLVHAVSARYFDVLGVGLALGRGLVDSTLGVDRPAVISWRFWQDRMHAVRDPLGARLTIGPDTTYIVTGVAPEGFHGPEGLQQADVWILPGAERWGSGRMFGRLAQGASLETASAELNALWFAIHRSDGAKGDDGWRASRLQLSLLGGGLHPENYRAIEVLVGGAAIICILILLIAAVNLAALVLTRAMARHRDIAVRRALGARTRDVVAEPASEVALLFLTASAMGLVVARPVGAGLIAALNAPFPFVARVHGNVTMIVVTIALAIVGALICAIGPALWSSRADPGDALRMDGGGTRIGVGARRLQSAFLAAQIAIGFVLVGCSFLVAMNAARQLRRSVGVTRPDRLLVAPAPQAGVDVAERTRVRELFRGIAEQATASPSDVATALAAPGENRLLRTNLRLVGDAPRNEAVRLNVVSRNFFATVGVPIMRGRVFEDADRAGGEARVVLSAAAAAMLFRADEAVGARVALDMMPNAQARVIGVVADVAYDLAVEREPVAYVLDEQFDVGLGSETSIIRLRDAAAATVVARQIDSTVRATFAAASSRPPRSIEAIVDDALRGQRALFALVIGCAATSIVVAILGAFGLVAYTVQERRREIAVRLALGARPASIMWLHASQALRLAVFGLLPAAVLLFGAASPLAPLLGPLAEYVVVALAAAGVTLLLATAAASVLAVRLSVALDPAGLLRDG